MATLLGVLAACAPAQPRSMSSADRTAAGSGWWYASFHGAWPAEAPPPLYLDALLADRVVAPLIAANSRDIQLWRFHRRAARDDAGHRFAFIFFAAPRVARRLHRRLARDPLLADLTAAGHIVRWELKVAPRSPRPGVADTSDPHWSAQMQQQWPHFIMGVSRTWLGLLQAQVASGPPDAGATTHELIAWYQGIDQALRGTWQREGGHALIHHLNALFGYGPVAIGNQLYRF